MLNPLTSLIRSDDSAAVDDSPPGAETAAQTDPLGASAETTGENDADESSAADASDLQVRLEELEEEFDSAESSVRALECSQDEMATSIDAMNETVRELVGIYDRIAAAENPFVDEDGAHTPGAAPPGEDCAVERASGDPANGHAPTDEGPTDDEAIVGFEDLADPQPRSTSLDGLEDEDASPPGELGPTNGEAPGATPAPDKPAPLLRAIPEGYASEILVMEWLVTLMEEAGPAAALRAINHYEDIDWISPAVRQHLVDVIAAPELDVFVDPTRPREPTATEHAVSHEYLQVLNRLDEL